MPASIHTPLEQLWPSLSHPKLKQLAWCCFGPKLIHDWPNNIHNRINPFNDWAYHWLLNLDKNPKPLLDFLTTIKNPRLGFLYEAYWQFYLQENPDTQLLACDFAIHHQGKTLGAFDVLFIDEANRVVHLELALKYYLSTPTLRKNQAHSPLGIWLGPGQKDQLQRKYQHLHHKQLQLSEIQQVQSALKAHGLPQPQLKQASLQGLLFQRTNEPQAIAPIVNRQCCDNAWYRQCELEERLNTSPEQAFFVLEQSQWLAPDEQHAPWISKAELLEYAHKHVSQQHTHPKSGALMPIRPFQVLLRSSQELTQPRRWFICPNDWPNN